MSSSDQQIKTSFEELGLTPEQIADETGYDVLAIKTILLQCSSAYRKLVKREPDKGYTPDQAEEMQHIMLDIARYEDEDQHLKFKAAKYLHEEFKGRNDINKQVQNIHITAINFNEQMKKALQARERTIKTINEVSDKQKELVEAC